MKQYDEMNDSERAEAHQAWADQIRGGGRNSGGLPAWEWWERLAACHERQAAAYRRRSDEAS